MTAEIYGLGRSRTSHRLQWCDYLLSSFFLRFIQWEICVTGGDRSVEKTLRRALAIYAPQVSTAAPVPTPPSVYRTLFLLRIAVPRCLTRSCLIYLADSEFREFLLSFDRFYWVLLGFHGINTSFYWVIPEFLSTALYWSGCPSFHVCHQGFF